MEEIDQQAARWDRWAPHYDGLSTGRQPQRDAVRLRELAPKGPALELGCGTGLVALELARTGTPVTGLDASPKMVDAFNAKAKADGLWARAVIGDMTRIELDQRFALVFVVASTLFCLTSQEEQVACFKAAADHLQKGGVFIVEARVPDWHPETRQAVSVRELSDTHAHWSAMLHDPVTQVVRSQEVRADENGIRLLPMVTRYAWPAELDLMARLTGMRLLTRHGDWEGGSFNPSSTRHLSVYTLDPSDAR
ncbi:class I SAM-dependent methyltransferase [Streptomyces sp. NBC_01381]|uniref:class I SAM-dependent DNA methyltransferase n=1 Tax=Streptomyces sp. NBC_01381 TaxID=2903845 RepID=UPI00224FFCD6|nr:class I SAM-dependent methyltransferase [Streptomyces sp. NBC_01381]MCX4669639.1 class I SAM-dependent methyltransferase [Streptomyces sp. NBC_01381]